MGILALAIYGSFFSDFSKAIEQNLRLENNSLIEEREHLQHELEGLYKAKSDVELELSLSKQNISDAINILNERESQLAVANSKLVASRRKLSELHEEAAQLKVDKINTISSLTQLYMEYYLDILPSSVMHRRLPKYMIRRLNEIATEKENGARSYFDDAYTGMLEYIDEISSQATTPEQRAAVDIIKQNFKQKCSQKEDWYDKVSTLWNGESDSKDEVTGVDITPESGLNKKDLFDYIREEEMKCLSNN